MFLCRNFDSLQFNCLLVCTSSTCRLFWQPTANILQIDFLSFSFLYLSYVRPSLSAILDVKYELTHNLWYWCWSVVCLRCSKRRAKSERSVRAKR